MCRDTSRYYTTGARVARVRSRLARRLCHSQCAHAPTSHPPRRRLRNRPGSCRTRRVAHTSSPSACPCATRGSLRTRAAEALRTRGVLSVRAASRGQPGGVMYHPSPELARTCLIGGEDERDLGLATWDVINGRDLRAHCHGVARVSRGSGGGGRGSRALLSSSETARHG